MLLYQGLFEVLGTLDLLYIPHSFKGNFDLRNNSVSTEQDLHFKLLEHGSFELEEFKPVSVEINCVRGGKPLVHIFDALASRIPDPTVFAMEFKIGRHREILRNTTRA